MIQIIAKYLSCFLLILSLSSHSAGKEFHIINPESLNVCSNGTIQKKSERRLKSQKTSFNNALHASDKTVHRACVCPSEHRNRANVEYLHEGSRVFSENAGRIFDSDGNRRDDVRYFARLNGLSLYLRDNTLSYVFIIPEDSPASDNHSQSKSERLPDCAIHPHGARTTTFRVDVEILGANTSVALRAADEAGIIRYYVRAGGVLQAREARTWKSVVYENVYDGIDLVARLEENGLKYDFRVHPGGNVSDIKLRYAGAENLHVTERGSLRFDTPLGSIEEHPPVSYQHHSGLEERNSPSRLVRAGFIVTGDTLRFDVESYDAKHLLIIDPFVEWATYYGGDEGEFGTCVSFDKDGNILVGGWTESVNFPATPGSLQTANAGKADAFIAKFRSDGTRVWTTYFGGSDHDLCVGLASGTNGEIAITGYTSSPDFPTSAGAFQTGNAGAQDVFITKLFSDGTVAWSTLFGGSVMDEGNGIGIDSKGNVIVTGRTISNDLPVDFTGFQFIKGAGIDAFLAKFSESGAKLWATYYGGVGEDWGHSVSIDRSDNILFSGHTESGNFPVTPNAFQRTFEGIRDGFFAKFSPAGGRIYATLLGGDDWDDAYGIATDDENNILLAGGSGSSNFPVTAESFLKNPAGSFDAYAAKFDSLGLRKWVNLFGGKKPDLANSIAVYPSGNMIVTGGTNSADFPTTPDAAQPAYSGGGYDAFVWKLRRDGSLKWGTYYGGTGDENSIDNRGLSSIAADRNGNAVITGWTSSKNFPVVNPYDSTHGGGWDAFIVKFGCGTSPVPAITADGPKTFCEGDSVRLDAGPGFFLYTWSTGERTRTITVKTTGNYFVSVTDTNDCVGTSPIMPVNVHASPIPEIKADGSTTLCAGDSVTLSAQSGFASYLWSNGATTPSIQVRLSGVFSVTVTDSNGCIGISQPVSVIVNPLPAPVISVNGERSFCQGGSVELDAGPGYQTYRWSTGATTQKITVTTAGSFSVNVTNLFNCSATSQPVDIIVFPKPNPVINPGGDISICEGDSVLLDAGGPYAKYLWSTGETTRAIVAKSTGTRAVTVTDSNNCFATSAPVNVVVNPKPAPVITPAGKTAFCYGDSVILDAGSGYGRYLWSSGDTTRTIVAKNSGAYSVAVTTFQGCSNTSGIVNVTVFPNPVPVITPNGPLAFCEGDSVILSAPYGFAEYLWSTGGKETKIIVKQSGAFSVSVIDSNGCAGASQSVTVTVYPNPAVPAISQTRDTLISTPEYGYQWYLNGVALSGETNRILIVPQSGAYSVTVTTRNGCSATSAPFPVAIALTTVSLPVLEAAPGERITIPLRLTSSENLKASGAKEYVAEIRFNKNILAPVSSPGTWSFSGDDRILSLHGQWIDTVGTLASFDCLAMLGNIESTPLQIEFFEWTVGAVRVSKIDGEFRLIICREGGARLFDAEGRISLSQNRPNPFNALTVIEYEVIEKGATQLYIMDMLGRRVATLVDGNVEPGKYRVTFDAASLSTGMYLYALQTPTQTLAKMMMVVK